MVKSTSMKAGLLVIAIMAMLLVPFAGSVYAQTPEQATQVTAAAAAGESASVLKSNAKVLQWSVFIIAAGEVAGLLGMGLSRMRQDKRQAKKELAMQAVVRPAIGELPLPYEKYRSLIDQSERNSRLR